ncbi:MAG TPA: NADH-quinone oxidoreductase subunit A [Phycisphaerae bacterium]|nr:NADH-quinone oxidoreductase subunit A [Phycisphaerae bacterium]HRW52285.1 NADH-quinone oxidoreductase subunit A [Phycisphaerae bacterium]
MNSVLAEAPNLGYGPIAVLLGIVFAVGVVILLLTHYLPKATRHGPEKDAAYESGMPIIGDARQRFNVKFYLVAMLFLIFDVELILMYPWAMAFLKSRGGDAMADNGPMIFWVGVVFFIIVTVGFIYEWGKGILRYD